jgi:hypothetical protein
MPAFMFFVTGNTVGGFVQDLSTETAVASVGCATVKGNIEHKNHHHDDVGSVEKDDETNK